MTNAVMSEMQHYNSHGNRGRCLQQVYNCLMLIGLQLQSLHSLQQVFCALTYALGSLATSLILCVYCTRTNVKTATNVDSSLTLLTTLAMSLSSLCLIQLCLQMDIELSLLEQLL